MSMNKITLVQPRHVYAPLRGDGHIHLSAPLIMAGARMEAGGYAEVDFIDENFGDASLDVFDADTVGINLVGAPYIPKAIQMIRDRVRNGTRVLLGGQIIDNLSDAEFEQLFCSIRSDVEVVNGNKEISSMPLEEEVSSILMWEKIPDEQMREYLSREFSFYLSQGCKYGCSFCQAKKSRPEKYRNMDIMKQDLEYLVLRAKRLGLDRFTMYLSNLDIFQTPAMIRQFAETVIDLKERHGFLIEFRGLAGVSSLEAMQQKEPDLLGLLAQAGLVAVGYGVDGDPRVWGAIKKRQNLGESGDELGKCVAAIQATRAAGITPEILMVVGSLADTEATLEAAYQFTKDMMERYGAVPRPHVAKSILPGTGDWKAEQNQGLVERLLAEPELFLALDYVGFASEISHPDPVLRRRVNRSHWRMVSLLGDGFNDYVVFPNTPEMRAVLDFFGMTIPEMNEGKYDR